MIIIIIIMLDDLDVVLILHGIRRGGTRVVGRVGLGRVGIGGARSSGWVGGVGSVGGKGSVGSARGVAVGDVLLGLVRRRGRA